MQLRDFVQMVAASLTSGKPSVGQQLALDPDYTDIYMKGGIHMDSELHFFDVTEAGEYIEYVKDGQRYIELFMLWQATELAEECLLSGKLTPDETVKRLIEYRINDA